MKKPSGNLVLKNFKIRRELAGQLEACAIEERRTQTAVLCYALRAYFRSKNKPPGQDKPGNQH